MPETGTSGLMRGDGKRDGAPAISTRAHRRLYLSLPKTPSGANAFEISDIQEDETMKLR
jgi:hypothetical protein